jgi:nucleotide-binding universal stress UspA family protein
VVEPVPLDAIRKLASREEADEVIVSTLPRRLSRWIAMDLPHRVRRATSLPVTHISGPAGPSL